MADTHVVTELLGAMQQGDDAAGRKLFELVYDELHKMASGLMAREHRKGHTLQPTALVHEAFLRLIIEENLRLPDNRRFFFFTAARAMRQLLIEHERKRKTDKGGGEWKRTSSDDILDRPAEPGVDAPLVGDDEHPWDSILDQIHGQYGVGFGELSDVIDTLAAEDERAAEIVWLRFMGGMTMKEIGECLGITESQADSEWRLAKMWLKGRLVGQDE